VRFLADENLDFAIVRALRGAGHDVRALAEETSRTVDAEVIALAAREARILLTEDKDFGWLAFVAETGTEGVILVRFPGNARQALASSVLDLVTANGEALRGSFIVVQPGQARITPGPRRPRPR
jgi:predicted nuclease of predicted toxin-antitoxin system